MATDIQSLLPRGLLQARRIESRRRYRVATREALVRDGRFCRAALMRSAVYAARVRQALTRESWRVCFADALSGTWYEARAERQGGVQLPRIYVTIR